MGKEKIIKDFILEIKKECPNICIGYEYNTNNDKYYIWHNLRNDECDFQLLISNIIKGIIPNEILYKEKALNISFDYDYDEARRLQRENQLNRSYLKHLIKQTCEKSEFETKYFILNSRETYRGSEKYETQENCFHVIKNTGKYDSYLTIFKFEDNENGSNKIIEIIDDIGEIMEVYEFGFPFIKTIVKRKTDDLEIDFMIYIGNNNVIEC